MKIMILGADGYLGWPMSANLSLTKHKLVMIDNYVKRSLFKKYGKTPLINYPKIDKRLKLLKNITKILNSII